MRQRMLTPRLVLMQAIPVTRLCRARLRVLFVTHRDDGDQHENDDGKHDEPDDDAENEPLLQQAFVAFAVIVVVAAARLCSSCDDETNNECLVS